MPLTFRDLSFDAAARRVARGGSEIKLTRKAFDLLAMLVERRPEAVSKDDIHARLWPETFVVEITLHSLLEGENLFGRGDADVVELPSTTVSRRHARISFDDHPWIEDLGSKNGTFVGEHRVSSRVRLNDGGSRAVWIVPADVSRGAAA